MESVRYLSDKLEALLGEWLAYAAIDHYYRYTHSELNPDFKDGDMTRKEMFENIPFSVEYDSMLTNLAYLFNRVGIDFSGAAAVCKFEDILETIDRNIGDFSGSFLFEFGAADTKSEDDYFTIERGCKPLFDQFVSEGYCTYSNAHIFWTSKIRPVFEEFGYWESKLHPTRDEKLFASLSPDLIKQLNHYADTNQFIMAVKTIKDAKGLDLRTAKFFIEDFMFPDKLGRTKEALLIKWHGPSAR